MTATTFELPVDLSAPHSNGNGEVLLVDLDRLLTCDNFAAVLTLGRCLPMAPQPRVWIAHTSLCTVAAIQTMSQHFTTLAQTADARNGRHISVVYRDADLNFTFTEHGRPRAQKWGTFYVFTGEYWDQPFLDGRSAWGTFFQDVLKITLSHLAVDKDYVDAALALGACSHDPEQLFVVRPNEEEAGFSVRSFCFEAP